MYDMPTRLGSCRCRPRICPRRTTLETLAAPTEPWGVEAAAPPGRRRRREKRSGALVRRASQLVDVLARVGRIRPLVAVELAARTGAPIEWLAVLIRVSFDDVRARAALNAGFLADLERFRRVNVDALHGRPGAFDGLSVLEAFLVQENGMRGRVVKVFPMLHREALAAMMLDTRVCLELCRGTCDRRAREKVNQEESKQK